MNRFDRSRRMNLTHPTRSEEVGWEVTAQPLLILNRTCSLSRKTNNAIKVTALSELGQRAWDQVAPSVPDQQCFEGEQDHSQSCGLGLSLQRQCRQCR